MTRSSPSSLSLWLLVASTLFAAQASAQAGPPPVAGLPQLQSAAIPGPLRELAVPRGRLGEAVMNAPLAGGRAYLYEQTAHHRPVAGTLNFPASAGAQRVWRVLIDGALRHLPAGELRRRGAAAARAEDIRYLVVHEDPIAKPGAHEEAIRALRAAVRPAARGDGVEVFDLWLD